MTRHKGRAIGSSLCAITGLWPGVAWALEGAPGANMFGLVLGALLLLAAGIGAWVSLRERHERRRGQRSSHPGHKAA